MKNDLDTLLKHHYEGKRLSDRQLQDIDDAAGMTQWLFQPMMACVFVALMTVSLLMPAFGLWPPGASDADTLSADIIKNHLAGKPVDFQAKDFDALTSHLTNADLPLRRPDLLNIDKAIKGARLCSLAGQPALQIYFSEEHQERTSLFIAKAQGALENIPFSGGNFDATVVLTWAENGHFYALAKDRL
ncbi:hypothetical protein [Marinobacter sp.]|uniref:hypothetical protein n=1 Tax=Marinobacter sp. TaxID=50741 RepID=UPI0019F1A65C|nr:hypothetical protein [Marinobacter sp.]MBE0486180.1 hypothetical protein [Marinobacter sp.]